LQQGDADLRRRVFFQVAQQSAFAHAALPGDHQYPRAALSEHLPVRLLFALPSHEGIQERESL